MAFGAVVDGENALAGLTHFVTDLSFSKMTENRRSVSESYFWMGYRHFSRTAEEHRTDVLLVVHWLTEGAWCFVLGALKALGVRT